MGEIAPREYEVKRADVRSLEHEPERETREIEGEQEKVEPDEKWAIVSKGKVMIKN